MPWSDGFVWPLPEPEHKPHAVIWTAHAVYESVAWIIPSPHADADARLIAAAPELLGALKTCVAHIRAMTHDFDDPEDEAPELVAADALIAKAEGRQP